MVQIIDLCDPSGQEKREDFWMDKLRTLYPERLIKYEKNESIKSVLTELLIHILLFNNNYFQRVEQNVFDDFLKIFFV